MNLLLVLTIETREGGKQISLFLEIKIFKVQVSKLIIRSEDDTKRFRIFSIDIEENVKQ